ncbi:hypothetical protein L1987_65003 [Smallanthus sonchifolius]|uniref:Uncharacterized protein n=1 Tax=Smallanthus sonchifolius TaxID=185202 RepID=A0ACB9BT92_9ASTR|nr:hypothetical protein L1987_65003 [Smallanthus sonchifolius]
MRDYREMRSCFSCGLVGHIRIACPHKDKGNRHVTPEKVRTPGKPYVNLNMVKPHDTPKGNSKSEDLPRGTINTILVVDSGGSKHMAGIDICKSNKLLITENLFVSTT